MYTKAIPINLAPMKQWLYDNFERFCQLNPEFKFLELTAEGVLLIMPPFGGKLGAISANMTGRLGEWSRQSGLGVNFASTLLYRLPNGAMRSPDASWITQAQWNRLRQTEGDNFPRLVPDFVVEFMDFSDDLPTKQAKMIEYMAVGVRLGWLLDPQTKTVEIYRLGFDKQVVENPTTLSGEDVLIGFTLELAEIFE